MHQKICAQFTAIDKPHSKDKQQSAYDDGRVGRQNIENF